MKMFLLLFVLPLYCFCQDTTINNIPFKEGKITYETIINVPGTTQKDLYNRAKAWAVTSFKSQKEVLQNDDKESGILVYKAYFPITHQLAKHSIYLTWQIWALYKIYVKDGKAKIVISDVEIKQTGEFSAEPFPAEIIFSDDVSQYKGGGFTSAKQMQRNVLIERESQREDFKKADIQFKSAILKLEDYFTGKIKSELDF